jgi:hypothetical protein
MFAKSYSNIKSNPNMFKMSSLKGGFSKTLVF